MSIPHNAAVPLAKPNGMPPFHTLTYTQGAQTHANKAVITEATLTIADMTEPSRGLFYLPIIYLWTGKRF